MLLWDDRELVKKRLGGNYSENILNESSEPEPHWLWKNLKDFLGSFRGEITVQAACTAKNHTIIQLKFNLLWFLQVPLAVSQETQQWVQPWIFLSVIALCTLLRVFPLFHMISENVQLLQGKQVLFSEISLSGHRT